MWVVWVVWVVVVMVCVCGYVGGGRGGGGCDGPSTYDKDFQAGQHLVQQQGKERRLMCLDVRLREHFQAGQHLVHRQPTVGCRRVAALSVGCVDCRGGARPTIARHVEGEGV